ncbi:MAG: hypothetical protein K8I60_20960 [Anaerolineae bacterium]|nr:hypothetical protein [Anaerolineae bacterium]
MVFLGELHKKVRLLFGVKSLIPGWWFEVRQPDTERVEELQILSYWTAELNTFQPAVIQDELVISILNTNKGSKGLILIPPLHEPRDRELGGPVDLFPVDIPSDWEDPVADTLRSVNFFPKEGYEIAISDQVGFEYTIEFATRAGHGNFHVGSGAIWHDESFNKLLYALHKAVRYLVTLYDDAEMRDYIHLNK